MSLAQWPRPLGSFTSSPARRGSRGYCEASRTGRVSDLVHACPMPDIRCSPPRRRSWRSISAVYEHASICRSIFAEQTFSSGSGVPLLTIPFGETRSYADIARKIGKPAASRAVGAANGCNLISIIAPCHRVIGNSGKLTGFAGGLSAKQYLLNHERLMAGAALV